MAINVKAEVDALVERIRTDINNELAEKLGIAAPVADAVREPAAPAVESATTRSIRRAVNDVKRGRQATRARGRGARYDLTADAVLEAVTSSGGPVSAEQLRTQHFAGVSSAALRRRLQELVASGKLKQTGEKRATRYAVKGRAR